MHGHHAHGVFAAALRKSDLIPAVFEPVQKFGNVQFPRLRHEAAKPPHPLFPARQGQEGEFHARFREDSRHDLRRIFDGTQQAEMLGAGAECLQLFREGVAVFFVRGAGGGEGIILFCGEADIRQLLVRDAAHVAFQRGGERNILRAVVEILQYGEHRLYLGIVAYVDLGGGGDGDAAADELAHDAPRLFRLSAGEHDDVAEAHFSLPARRGVGAAAADFGEHDVRNQRALGVLLVLLQTEPRGDRIYAPLGALRLLLFGHELEAHLAPRLRRAARLHHRGGSVIDRADLLRHRRGKEGVDGIEDVFTAAEIAVQGERPPILCQPRVLFGEEARAAPAEAVDGLLRVADHEHVFARDEGQNALLRGVNVLIFVDKDVRIAAAHLLAHGRDVQKFQALVLQVGKVQSARPPLERRVCIRKFRNQFAQRRRDLARGAERPLFLLPRAKGGQALFDGVDVVLEGSEACVQLQRRRVARVFQLGVGGLIDELDVAHERRGVEHVPRGEHVVGKQLAGGEVSGVLIAERARLDVRRALPLQRGALLL